MLSPKNMHMSNIQTEKVIFTYRNICAYSQTYMNITIIDEKRDHELEKKQRRVYGQFTGKKGRVEMI